MLAAVIVLGVWWDVYHSSAQTFGLCRIYDMKRGNPAEMGRRLDFWLNILIYCGPILAGVTLFDHLQSFHSFDRVDAALFASVPAFASEYQRVSHVGARRRRRAVLAVLRRFVRRGWRARAIRFRVQKTALLVTTALVSLVTWGFNSFGEAFFIMNFFHAVQYFAIVWWSEQKNIGQLFGYDDSAHGTFKTLLMFVSLPLTFGMTAALAAHWNNQILLNMQIVVSIMHFWYDGFIWSVRKKQVAAA